ncbi:MAG: FHA domain-containing protein, partial [Anaerolineae bacterium]|nr:FHA domain-containing protein [Anaerolineae bacterium]
MQPLTSARAGVGRGIEFEVPTDPALQYTCLYDAMWEAIEDLTGGQEERGDEFARMKKAIFVFSDGLDSGLSACRYELTDVKKLLIARDPKGKISVYAVGVGPEEGDNFRDLMNLADITEGEFFHYFGEREDAQRELNGAFDRSLTQGEQYVIRYGTEACADQVTLRVEAGGRVDEEEVTIPPVEPIIRLSSVEPGQTVSGILELKPEFVLEQCPIREVTYYVNGEKAGTFASPFTWKWDTSSLPDNPNVGPVEVGNGLIENVTVRVEAVDQKGYSAEDEISGIVVEIPHPEVEIVEPSSSVFIERWVKWRTECEDAEPVELSVRINVTHSNRERQIEGVRYHLDGQEDSFQQLPAQYALDISSVGCEAIDTEIDTETEQILTVEVTDDLGLSGKAEIPLTVSVHIETFWEAVGRFFRNQASLIPAWLSLVLVIALGVYVLVVGPRQAVETVTVGLRKVTEFLGIATKGTRLVLIEDGKDGRPYAVYDVTHMGRDETKVDVAFDHARISRLHATLVKEDEEFVLYDQGSKNGTWVNERRLPFKGHRVLENNDIIDLGQGGIRLRFEREG